MNGVRLLICDDVEDIRMLMRVAFETDDDFEVIGEATNGAESVAAARTLSPDVILLDLNMPVKSGLDALPELREAVPDAAIVIFSGFEAWSLGDQTEDNGADAYIEKGTEVHEVVDHVRSVVLERRRRLSEIQPS